MLVFWGILSFLQVMKHKKFVSTMYNLCIIELEQEPAQVFLSYQWDSQDEVKALRDRLERSGYSCWMDIGQMGGGDQLYTKIDEALRQSKV